MSEYIKREDAEQVLTGFINKSENPITLNDVVNLLGEIYGLPDADVVEVVRCEGCKHCLKEDEYELWCYGRGFPARLVRADEYCSYGADMRGG